MRRIATHRHRVNSMRIPGLLGLFLLLLGGCGYRFGQRHFAEPIVPRREQEAEMVVGDDRSITFLKDRLEVSLRPLTPEMLNRQFPDRSTSQPGFFKSNPYVTPTNPYTYGDWSPPEQDQAPPRFTVFLLRVKNYAYPKVRVDPADIEIVAPNGRRFQALNFSALVEYYWPYAVAYAGNTYRSFKERKDLLLRTMFKDDMVFSGQETEGYVLFPPLNNDIEEFTVWIRDMTLRFDFRNEPVEMVDIPYQFYREVYLARHPRTGER